MILYHATYETRAKEILSAGVVKSTGVIRNFDTSSTYPTTEGFVYLTDSFPLSIFYGARVIPIDSNDQIYIFEVEVSEEELLVDEDEIGVMSIWPRTRELIQARSPFLWNDSLEILHSVRVKRDLIIGVDVKRYLTLPTDNYVYSLGTHDKQLQDIEYASSILMQQRDSSTPEQIDRLLRLVDWTVI
ncbi:hypothetical protein ABER99_21520 [Paenibacillus glucanolyticus]|jgi:hypothetical protein|uniref:Uncharacterized protein n=1 Tax=Paenibacillus glucanolyticus TaxID=59843 RepID=A0A163GUQ7_9BACL|nr:hypothetical protein [Paenibacillus glucanolyticus]KZS45164.1 hypothetical protein AWU65_04060 [Paenibacillus glucanolyticus]OMF64433.1 hypothetical protein BK142_31950 [Paenibacillus glucanolyticus]